MVRINPERLDELMKREQRRFLLDHPESQSLYTRAQGALFAGVPMNWMTKWAGGFPVFVQSAKGSHFVDVDDRHYVDFCLGDTGAMTGHSPDASVQAISEQIKNGLTFMLPTEDAIWVGEELSRRFGLPYWQFTLTATDANRFALRIARAITRRKRVLVFNWCYHGTVDETFITLSDGSTAPRKGNLGYAVSPTETTEVVEFNDLAALEKALAKQDVACVIAEPVMTNIGIIHPDPGFHEALRELTRRYGTLLIIDETHTICTGPSGYTGKYQLEPDLFTIGKPLASGVPAGAFGMSAAVAEQLQAVLSQDETDTSGIGGTLAGNALSIAAMRATLTHVLTESNFERMIALATRFTDGINDVIAAHSLPWHVTQLGSRVEYLFQPNRPRNGAEAASLWDHDLDRFIHLYMLNRGILLTPFHNMALMSPDTTVADVDLHTAVFAEVTEELTKN